MEITKIIDAFGYVIYAALALLAVWGVYNAILLYRSLAKKSVPGDANALLAQVRDPQSPQAARLRAPRHPEPQAR